MGCVYSQQSRRSRDSHNSSHADNARVFHVCNVDDRGQEVNTGKIEITDAELALHQKGRNSIFWSLRSLRRYGFDAELFSFECGRRCPTGPGIYAFKCSQAEQLFNALQEAIQMSTLQNNHVIAPEAPPELNPRFARPPEPHAYTNSPFYVNTSAAAAALPTTRSDVNTNYAKLDDLVRFYVNIKTPVVVNGNGKHTSVVAPSHAPFSAGKDSPPQTPPAVDPVNYIMLDLDTNQPQPTVVTTAPPTPVAKTPQMEFPPTTPPVTPTASTAPPMPYAQIDFAKTGALSASAANRRKL
ncbi:unnamed protein product [Medioppia subpectinata]|uniref:IRS-type PTB domain-containing protein n=1 Tax=Medioppia subpectinata TaxID=1979941 RepID=A0A7R9KIA5_9ACAR|nr:unnamed protein product [Medioppia subpectinata]CAG2103751.1 unnamed protein product [Medioppia subpectinata]